MPSGTLYTIPTQASGKAVRAVAAFGGVTVDVPEKYVHHQDNEKPEFTNKFGHGKIPAWEGEDGFLLFEGATIARYVATLAPNSGLLGTNREEAALIDQWVHLTETELDFHTTQIRLLLNGVLFPYSRALHNTFLERQARALATLEKHISTRTFFVGERITVADIYIATLVQRACISNLDTAARKTVPNLIRHMETLVNQPAFAGIYGPTPVVEKAPVYVAPKKDK
ncbi:glutathione S-transferase C-terminal-like protein [Mycena filopes]|nr:glutathione S-transferase C-terminal-like protein [Mycena filopes]